MKIAVVGPGAIGCFLAALLSKAKEDVWLLDKDKERAKKISQQKISLTGLSGDFQAGVKVSAEPKEIGEAELVVICVKAYDTKQAINHARPLIGDETRVLALQNGIGNVEIISEAVGSEKVVGGVTNQGVTLSGPGCVKHAGRGETLIGRIDGKVPVQMQMIRQVFNKAGLQTRITRDIKGVLWSKLIINAGINALAAITRLKNGELLEFEETRRILRGAVTEAVRVAKRKRVKLLYDDPLAKAEAVCEATSGNISSMLQDILKKKRTEIDVINGVIVRLGQELNIAVPVNSLLTDLVKVIERNKGW